MNIRQHTLPYVLTVVKDYVKPILTNGFFILAILLAGISNANAQSYALDFNGVDQTAGNATQSGVGVNFTVEFWVNPHTTTTLHAEQSTGLNGTANAPEYAVYPIQAGSAGGLGVAVGTNGIVVYGHGDGFLPSLATKAITIGGWTHVAIVVSNNTPTIYVNGNFVHTGLQAPRTLTPSMILGGGSFGYFDGQMDEFRVWSYAKSAGDVKVNYYRTNIRPDENGLFVYYRMDEGSGTTIDDIASANLNGNLSAAWVAGIYSENYRGLEFDGTDDFVTISNDAGQYLSSGSEGTYEVWLKTSNAGDSFRGLVVRQYAAGMFMVDNELLAYDWALGQPHGTGIYLNDGNWHHVSLAFKVGETNGSHMYVDGNLVKTFTLSNVTDGTNYATTIGSGSPAGSLQHYTGQLDEAKIWNVRRTQAQIQSSISAQITGSETGLLVGYRFQSVSGQVAYDETLGNRWGILQSSMTDADWVNTTIPTVSNTSLDIDGSSERLEGVSAQLPATFTIEAWIYSRDNSGVRSIFRKGRDYDLYINNGTLYAEVWEEGGSSTRRVVSGPSVSSALNMWTHVAFTWNSGVGIYYLNGVQYTGSTGGFTTVDINSNLGIGGSSLYGQHFNGLIEDVKIWNVVKTQAEINNGLGVDLLPGTANLVGYYKMNSNSNNTMIDYSGNGYNLTGLNISSADYSASVPSFTDNTAPVFEASTPSITSNTGFSFNINVDLSEPGTAYYVVVPDGESAPSSAQVKAGQKSNGTSALKSGNQALSTGSLTHTFTVTNLYDNTAYDVYVVAQDDEAIPNVQASPTKRDVTTPDINTSVTLDGSSEYFAGTNNSVPSGASAFTIEAWIYPDVMGGLGIAGWGNYGAVNQVNALRLSNDGISHYMWFNDLTVTTGSLTGGWHHVAATYDGTTRSIYLDGNLIASDTPSAPNVQLGNFTVGATYSGNEKFDGKLDELRIWNSARTQSEIQAGMTSSFSPGTSNLRGYYKMDGNGSTLIDFSGNGYHLGGGGIDASNWVASSTFTPGPEYLVPVFENSTPSISSITETSFNLFVDVNEPGTLYYVVVPNGESAPSSNQVKAGQKNNGTAAIKSGSQAISSGSYSHTFLVSGLIAGTDYDVYVVAQDDETSPNIQASATKRDVTTLDITAPSFENSTPLVNGITGTSFNLTGDVNEAGTLYYVVVPNGEAAPSSAQVKAGQKNNGTAALKSGLQAVTTGGFSHTFSITGLNSETAYDVYLVAQDDESTPNIQASATKRDVTTLDITAPSFENSTPSLSAIGAYSANLTVDINEAGTLYFIVIPDGASAPSSAQVKAGQNASSSAALFSGSQAVNSGNYSHTFNLTGLRESTAYDVYVVAQDDESTPNVQVSATKSDLTTIIGAASVEFDGTTEFYSGTNNNLPTGSSSFTMETWIYPDQMGLKGIAGWGNYGVNNQVNALRLLNDGIIHYMWGNDLLVTTSSLTNAWHHVAVTYDGTTRFMYLDGALIGSDTPSTPNVQLGAFTVGATSSGGEKFDGKLDEVRIWNVARTQAEIVNSMGSEFASGTSNLVAYYKMNNSGSTTLFDYSGNNNNLTGTGIDASNYVAAVSIPSDVTAPIFEQSTPSLSSPTATGFTIDVDLNEPGTVYYVVVNLGEAAPSTAQVKSGLRNSGSAAIKNGNQALSTGSLTHQFAVTGLTANTAYDVYVVAQDDAGTPNVQASPTKITNSGSYAYPLFVQQPEITMSSSGIDISINADRPGIYYWLILDGLPSNLPTAQVKTWIQSSTGEAYGSTTINENTGTIQITGLQHSKTYHLYLFAESTGDNTPQATVFRITDRTDYVYPGQALSLSNQRFLSVNSSLLSSSSAELSVEAWINPSEITGTHEVVSEFSGNSGYSIQVQSDGSVIFYVGNGSSTQTVTTPAGSITTNTWSHIAGVYNGSDMRVYVNGVEKNRVSFTGNVATYSVSRIGVSATSLVNYFVGTIDEVRIWNRAITQAEINTGINLTYESIPSGLLRYFNFDDANGYSTIAGEGTVISMTAASSTSVTPIQDNEILITHNGFGFSPQIAFNYTSPTLVDVTSSTAKVWLDVNNSATIYHVILPENATAPSASQIKAGNGNGQTVYQSGSTNLTTGTFSGIASISGLSANTAYTAYFAAEDGSNNLFLLNTNGFAFSTTPTSPYFGKALTIAQNNTYGQSATAASTIFSGSETAFSVDMIIKPSQLVTGRIIDLYNGKGFFVEMNSTGNVRFAWNSGKGLSVAGSGDVLQIDEWYHITITYDATSILVYVDGQLKSTTGGPGSINVSGLTTLGLGGYGPVFNTSSTFRGQMDEIRIWDKKLTQSEISSIQGQIVTSDPNLKARYSFDTVADLGNAYYAYEHVNESLALQLKGFGSAAEAIANSANSYDFTPQIELTSISSTTFSPGSSFTVVGTGLSNVDAVDDIVLLNPSDFQQVLNLGSQTKPNSTTLTVSIPGGVDTTYINQPLIVAALKSGGGMYRLGDLFHFERSESEARDYYLSLNNSVIVVPDKADFATSGLNATYELWFRTSASASGYQTLISKPEALGLYLKDNKLAAYDWTFGDRYVSTQTLNDGNWHHVAIASDLGSSNATTVYLDGDAVATFTQTVSSDNYSVFIGSDATDASTQTFTGDIDEVRIWNTVRTAVQIASDMDADLPGSTTGLLANYKLDSKASASAFDYSNNQKHGTLVAGSGNWQKGQFLYTPPSSITLNTISDNLVKASGSITFNDPWLNVVDNSYSIDIKSTIDDQLIQTVSSLTLQASQVIVSIPANIPTTKLNEPVYMEFVNAQNVRTTINKTFHFESENNVYSRNFSSDYIAVPSSTAFNTAENTYELWFKTSTDVTGYQGLVVKPGVVGVFLYDNRVAYYDFNSGSLRYIHSTVHNDGQWHHVALARSGAGTDLYIDGTIVSTNPYVINNSNPIRIGTGVQDGSSQTFSGLIDEVRIWDDVRSAQEIQNNYSTQVSVSEANLISYYRMDSKAGELVFDYSPNAYHATVSANSGSPQGTWETQSFNTDVAPYFTSGTPTISQINDFGFDASVITNLNSTIYYILVADGAAAPTTAQVKTGSNYAAVTVLQNGSFSTSANVSASSTLTGLSRNTNYDIYLVAESAANSSLIQAAPTKRDVQTTDLDSPVFEASSPVVSNITTSAFDLFVDMDIAGTINYVVLANDAPAPNYDQIKLGTDGSDNAGITSGNYSALTGDFSHTFSISGLADNTDFDVYVIAKDNRTPSHNQANPVKLELKTADGSAPVFENSTPVINSITATGFDLSTDLDEAGTVYYVVVADGSAAPSSAQVKDELNGSGSTAIATGTQVVNSAEFTHTFTPSGLSSETAYDVYVVAQDDETTPNVQATATKVDVTTGDGTPPVFENSTPSVTSITSAGFRLDVDLNEAGTMYYVVVPDGAAVPTSAQVKAGTNASDAPALASNSQTVVSESYNHTFTISGLTYGNNYNVYIVAEDDEVSPNIQASATKLDVSFVDTSAPILENPVFYTYWKTPYIASARLALNEPSTVWYTFWEQRLYNGPPTVQQVKDGVTDQNDPIYVKGTKVFLEGALTDTISLGAYTGPSLYEFWVVTEDTLGNTSQPMVYWYELRANEVMIEGGGVPTVSNKSTTGFDVTFDLNGPADLYYRLRESSVPNTNIKPENIPAQTDGKLDLNSGDNSGTVTFSSLSEGLSYYVDYYIVNYGYTVGYVSSVLASTLEFIPPVFENVAPVISAVTIQGFDVLVDLNESSTAYYVVLPGGAPAPSAAQVKAGTNAADGASIANGSQAISSGEFTHTITITGLAEKSPYAVFVVAEDASNNLMSTPVARAVQTKARPIAKDSSLVFNASLGGAFGRPVLGSPMKTPENSLSRFNL